MHCLNLFLSVYKRRFLKFPGWKLLPDRHFFTKLELGVIQFENYRQNILNNFKSPKEIEVYKKNSINEFANLKLDEQRDKLKEFIFLIDNREEDFKALKLFLMQYHNAYNNNVHNVKEFVFGTQIMRVFYILNLPDEAVRVSMYFIIFIKNK